MRTCASFLVSESMDTHEIWELIPYGTLDSVRYYSSQEHLYAHLWGNLSMDHPAFARCLDAFIRRDYAAFEEAYPYQVGVRNATRDLSGMYVTQYGADGPAHLKRFICTSCLHPFPTHHYEQCDGFEAPKCLFGPGRFTWDRPPEGVWL